MTPQGDRSTRTGSFSEADRAGGSCAVAAPSTCQATSQPTRVTGVAVWEASWFLAPARPNG